jgi:hypothetical protein
MNAYQAIILARKNIGGIMESGARLRLEDAVILYDAGHYDYAAKAALDSLKYSVGIFHEDCKKVAAFCKALKA